MNFPETELLTSLVSRVFRIEDVTTDDSPKGRLVRYRGHLIDEDSSIAYDKLAELVKPYGLTPLFRIEKEAQVIYLAPTPAEQKLPNPWVNIVLFIATVFSVMLAGAQPEGPVPSDLVGQLLAMFKAIFTGWPFALSLLGILLAHEFGHYLVSRYHKTPATLPYFIPFRSAR